MTRRIGVLALQGGFAAHARALGDLGHQPVLVRDAATLAGVDGLCLPGGESTAQLWLIDRAALTQPIRAFVASGRPVLATCAGLILLARRVTGPEQPSLALLDVSVARNAWGRQVDSFEALSDDARLALLFIRAPRVVAVGPDVAVRATFRGEPVLVQSGNVTGATFHPELSADRTVHRETFSGDVERGGEGRRHLARHLGDRAGR